MTDSNTSNFIDADFGVNLDTDLDSPDINEEDNIDDSDGVAPEVPLISPERESRINEQSGHDIDWFSSAHAVLIQHDDAGHLLWAIDCPNLGRENSADSDTTDSETAEAESSCIVSSDDGTCRCGLYDDTLFSIQQLDRVAAADADNPRPATWVEQLAHDHGEGTFFVGLSTTTITSVDGDSYVVRCGCDPVRVEGAPAPDLTQH